MNTNHYHDVLIIGSGAAGLTAALHLATNDHHNSTHGATCKIAMLAKGEPTEGSTTYAQGGIAAVMAEEDSIESHIKDTLIAGAGLCDEKAVRFVTTHARTAINWLTAHDVQFNKALTEDGRLDYHLTREGGHSHRRILHSADATGNEIESKLIKYACDKHHHNIELFADYTAVDLITQNNRCVGAYALNNHTGKVEIFRSKFTILATGGASKVYLYTSNPDCSSGDGIAMAWRRGCRVANMEFNQFHPTCLYHPKTKSFLITEAMRGEGAILTLPSGERFMPRFDKRAELAPRDIVARAIDHEMKRLGIDHVNLDISHKPSDFIISHFPNIYRHCLELGYDITKESIPVVPAAHYTCGGVVVDQHGRTDIENLYAIGEVSCTGLHGANRMASNSLLECIVYGTAASQDIRQKIEHVPLPQNIRPWDESQVTDSDEEIVVTHNWAELRRAMWDYVGIMRTNKRLERACHRIDLLRREIHEYYGNFRVTKNLLELRNLVAVAHLIVDAAMKRKTNIGLHYNLDNKK
jgi:L-aspartate oxidase